MSDNNRRHFRRVDFDAGCRVASFGVEHDCELSDISLRGALVRTPTTLRFKSGQPCRLSICLADSDIVLLFECEVTRVDEHYMGFRFVAQDLDSFTHLRRLLEVNIADPEILNREFSSWSGMGEN
ncbi:MAG: PilZ domain-containing protein [Gammaproteobacteria bacterium]|nr:PilZ domain-containing protein [Gammaproteobacteria bacterium]